MAGPYNIYLFDNCCHQWVSTNSGVSFVESGTPTKAQDVWGMPAVGTLLDDWSDAQMAINDADYLSFVGFDNNYNSNVGFGIIGISKLAGVALSWSLSDPEKSSTGIPPSPAFMPASNPSFGTDWQNFFSGAITANASTILCCPVASSMSDHPFYPRISTNGGATWADVTSGLPANQTWARAAFSAGGTTMYLKPDNESISSDHFIFKSTNSGATWTELAAGPKYLTIHPDESLQRMRCSSNGSVIVTMAMDGNFWLSTNGGTSWTNTNFATTLSVTPGEFGDCSVTPDGNTIVVSFEQRINNGTFTGNWPVVLISTNGGSSFTNVTANLQYPASAGAPTGGAPTLHPTGCTAVNVAPDGLGVIVTFNYLDNPHMEPDGLTGNTGYVNVSTNSGAAFTLRSFDVDPLEASSVVGVFTAIYITPFTPITPPAPNPIKPNAPVGWPRIWGSFP